MARRDRGADEPGEELVGDAPAQAARRFPLAPARVRGIEIVGPRALKVMFLRAGFAEIERHDGRDAFIERSGHRRRVAATRDGAQHDNTLRIDIGSFQEQVDAAHQVPDHPFHQALAGHIELHAQCVTRVVALPEPGLRLDALAGAELVHDEHGGPGSCPRHPEVL